LCIYQKIGDVEAEVLGVEELVAYRPEGLQLLLIFIGSCFLSTVI